MPAEIRKSREGILLKVRIIPGASRNEVVGPVGDSLKIRIRARAREGKANEELVEFLSSLTSLPKRSVVIIKGESSRTKLILFATDDLESIRKSLPLG